MHNFPYRCWWPSIGLHGVILENARIMYFHLHINLRLYIAYVTIHNSHLRIVQFLEAKCGKV